MGEFKRPFDRRELWDSLDAGTKTDTLLEDVASLSKEIAALRAAAQQQYDQTISVASEIMRYGEVLAKQYAAIDSYEEGLRAPPPPPTPTPTVVKPHIEVAKKGSDFEVTGVDFAPNKTVTVRVADDFANQPQNFQKSADAAGDLRITVSPVCVAGGRLHFSATDSRRDDSQRGTGVMWSNTVDDTC